MALVDLNHGAAHQAALRDGHGKSLLHSIANYFERRALYRQTLRELNGLTDRELNDLGIHRLDIMRIAKVAATSGK